jgi:L-threonylcarbamoyladenylate synthase
VGVYEVTDGVPSKLAIEAAARALAAGDIVAIPTDTVYGLVADVSYTGAADRLFALKRRQREDDLSVIVSDTDQALTVAVSVPEPAERLMDKFWPGPLTLVLPRDPEFVADLGDDDITVGVRCPAVLVARLLCEEAGPLAITTANVKGSPPATTAREVVDAFGREVEVVLDGGSCNGSAATVVDCTGAKPKLLREGAVQWSDIETVVG